MSSLIAKLRGWGNSKIAGRVEELRKLVDLPASVLERFPHEISGGQKQRVAIMRAAMMDPAVMLLDEPMAALDPLIRRSLQQELKSIFNRLGKTVLIVTHDLGEAVFLADRITLLHEGRILQSGSYADLLRHPADPFVTLFINAQRTLPDTAEVRMKKWLVAALILAGFAPLAALAAKAIVVGSKVFTEGYILGEIAAQTSSRSRRSPSSENSAWAAREFCSRP